MLHAPLGVHVEARVNMPDLSGWENSVTTLLSDLSLSDVASESPVITAAAMETLARLAAANGGEAAQQALASRGNGVARGADSAAMIALGDMARSEGGRAALEELVGARVSGGSALDDLEAAEEAAAGGPGTQALAALETLARSTQDQRGRSDTSSLGSDQPMQEVSTFEGSSPLTKVVMARRTQLALSGPLDPFALLAALRRRNSGAYVFAMSLEGGSTFLGATPERLFALEDGQIATEAVAGTRARGLDERGDAALAYDLLTCPKEHAEFTIVRDWVTSILQRVCRPGSVTVDADKTILRNGCVSQYSRDHLIVGKETGQVYLILSYAIHPFITQASAAPLQQNARRRDTQRE